MRDVAVVSTATRQEPKMLDTEPELMIPLINDARDAVGLTQADIGFTCSGSSDFLAGQAFSFVMTLDAVGPVPPIAESHVEMDGAWALYEAWVKLQIGEVDTALVYSYGKPSPGSLRDVLSTQLDPYHLAPLWPDAFALAGLQARNMLDSGVTTTDELGAVAERAGKVSTMDEYLAQPMLADPLRAADCPSSADGGVAVVLAAGDRANELTDRPAWITGIDHRIDAHHLGVRDLTRAPSAALAAEKAGVGTDKVDRAELHSAFTTHDVILRRDLGLGDEVEYSPEGGALTADTMMASGLLRIAAAADAIALGTADRAVAHAAAGPLLQQNLVCVLEGA
ncbi:MAG: lipid-transfer protein [Actinomycetota bacterium]